jgi:chromosome partitioning protein
LGKIIAIANQKGGVGKTTTAINLSACLAAADCRVLVIDCDPQANATSGLGYPNPDDHPTLYDLVMDEVDYQQAKVPTQVDRLDLIAASRHLAGANLELVDRENRETRLRDKLSGAREAYDFVLLDCPPALDLLTLNALVAADSVLIPIQCEYFALEGVSALLDTIDRVKAHFNPELAVEGVLLTMYDDRTTLMRQVARDLRSFFQEDVFQTSIPRNVRLAEAPSHGRPIIEYDLRSRGAESYLALAREILTKKDQRSSSHTAH